MSCPRLTRRRQVAIIGRIRRLHHTMYIALPLLLLASTAPSAIAVLPTFGDSDAARAHAVEIEVRGALLDLDTPLQAHATTAAGLARASSVGIECAPRDVGCLRAVAAALDVDGLVIIEVFDAGDTAEVELAFIEDAQHSAVRTARSVLLTWQEDRPGTELDYGVLALFAPERLAGELALRVFPAGAKVFVDDALIGLAPIGRRLPLSAGAHDVRVEHDGHRKHRQVIDIAATKTAELLIELEPMSLGEEEPGRRYGIAETGDPPIDRSIGGARYTLLGVGAAAAVLGAGAGLAGAGAMWLAVSRAGAPLNGETAADRYQSLQLLTGLGYGLSGTGVLVFASGAAVALGALLVE